MKLNYTLPPLLAVLLSPGISGADPIAIKGNLSFIAANSSLTIAPLAVGNMTSQVDYELPEDCPKSTPIPIEGDQQIALDIILQGDYAVVANFNSAEILKTVNISACLSKETDKEDDDDHHHCDKNATVDLEEGSMHIPCLDVDGKYYSLEMDRRGHSDNWLVNMESLALSKTKEQE
ncbi:hypothetical protein [Methyloprofundus sp.]|uniref:hypothetical protein n=1 Tax=Methyloprofundus sp. TaxID=2020875 RepID=UPI003D0AEF56